MIEIWSLEELSKRQGESLGKKCRKDMDRKGKKKGLVKKRNALLKDILKVVES